MSKPIPFLEFRAASFYWRRRVPVAVLSRYSNSVFCFPLKTNVLREAAAVASRITAISDICFRAEIDVSPDVMTKLLVTYARLEIEASDRLRALTGPRTRAAAEAGLAMETAIRASLRDAIFLCEREPAFQAVESTARHLGIEIAGDDEDLPILVDKMMRLMLELSEERERRAQGYFSDRQPYLAMALSAEAPVMSSAPLQGREPKVAAAAPMDADMDPVIRPMFVSRREMATPPVPPGQDPVETVPSPTKFEQEDASFSDSEQTAAGQIVAPQPVLFEDGGVSLTFRQEGAAPISEEPSIVGLFDIWFDFRLKGCLKHGAYEITDAGLGSGPIDLLEASVPS